MAGSPNRVRADLYLLKPERSRSHRSGRQWSACRVGNLVKVRSRFSPRNPLLGAGTRKTMLRISGVSFRRLADLPASELVTARCFHLDAGSKLQARRNGIR